MTFSSALLQIAEMELLETGICPTCGARQPDTTLLRVRGRKQKIVGDDKIGARCADGKNMRTWMRKVPVIVIQTR